MKKVLIITYYWPPSGGAGVQRCLKLVKYLREYGWEPVVFTADNAEYPVLDASLEKDIPKGIAVWKQAIWEPYNFYKKFIGQKKGEKVYSGFMRENKKSSFTQSLSIFIRGNFFIPDARRFWIKPSIRFLINKLKDNPVDAIISSGPPHSTHLIAKGVTKKLQIPWLADFRDPWTQIDFYDQLKLTRLADEIHKKQELSVLHKADKVSCVSWHWAADLEKIGKREVQVITNGFDPDDFPKTEIKQGSADSKFIIQHIGSLNKDRNPHQFWEALKELASENAGLKNDLQITLVGKNDFEVYQSMEQNGLSSYLNRIDYVPHSEVNNLIQQATVLLLPLNDTPNVLGIIPGKIFEYLAAQKPILAIGTELGDSARIIKETGTGVVCGFKEKEKMKAEVLKFYQDFKAGRSSIQSHGVEKYSRKNVAKQMAELLNSIAIKL